MRSTARRRRFVRRALLLLLALALTACGSSESETTAAPAADGVRGLENVLQLRGDFEAEKGSTRLLVLLSPT
jgi:ABC-type glycerol-3-phosphate transport system substrate-binding protein